MSQITDFNSFNDFKLDIILSLDKDFTSSFSGFVEYDSRTTTFIIEVYNHAFEDESFDEGMLYAKAKKNIFITFNKILITKIKWGSLSSTTLNAHEAFIGDNFVEDLKKLKIKKISFSFNHLNEWLRIRSFNFTPKEIEFIEPKLKKYFIPSIKATLEEIVETNKHSDYLSKISIKNEKYYQLSFDEFIDYQEVLTYINTIIEFFYFIFNDYLKIKFLRFEIGETTRTITNAEGNLKPYKVSQNVWYFASQTGQNMNDYFNRSNNFDYDYISNNLEKYLNQWFEYYEKLQIIIQTFTSDFKLDSFVETNFLNAARNIEAFHRVFFEEDFKEKPEITKMKTTLINFLKDESKETREYFITRIKHPEASSFRKRIEDCLQKTPVSLLKKVIKYNDKPSFEKSLEKFSKSVVESRNYLTHNNDNRNKYKNSFTGYNLRASTEILNLILVFLILELIGIDSTKIESYLTSSKRYQFAFMHTFVTESF